MADIEFPFNRVEIIDHRPTYMRSNPGPPRTIVIDPRTRDRGLAGISIQDDGKTLKIFITKE